MKEITGSREGRCALIKIFTILLIVDLFQTLADAAETVRISISNLSGQFVTFPLAHKRGFLKEEGIEAEIIALAYQRSAAGIAKITSASRMRKI